MRLTSLRSKIFLLVGLILVLMAVAVLAITQRNVTRTVVSSEELAVHNVVKLLVRDTEARWGALLNDKINTVRTARRQLVQLGATVRSVLALLQSQAERHELTPQQAQDRARRWINHLVIDGHLHAFAFDGALTVIASGDPSLRGLNLATLRDFKGHALASSAYRDARTTGQSFAIYRIPARNGSADMSLRYAYFGYFEPWDWIFALSGEGQQVVEQFEQRRKHMEQSLREALSSLQLASSGFAFIVDDSGRMISPAPPNYSTLTAALDTHEKRSLADILKDTPEDGSITRINFNTGQANGQWAISASYFKPLKWTIVAAVPANDLTSPAIALRNRLALIFIAALVVSMGLAWALAARITRPLKELTQFARALPEHDLSQAAPIPERIARLPAQQPDEVGRLASTFMLMDKQLRDNVAQLLRETSTRERYESELTIARDIQTGLLPPPLPNDTLAGAGLHATMIPAKEVGGDLFDYFELTDGRLCVAIGDVSDKGVPAALFMAVTRTLIRASAEEESDPARIMARVNNRLSANNPNMMFVTLLIAVFDPGTGELEWCNAGHPYPFKRSADGSVGPLQGRGGPACGVQEDISYTAFTTVLQTGEALLGYTDGVSEALAPDGTQYGESRLLDLLNSVTDGTSRALNTAILNDVRRFARGTEQSDDITLIAVQRLSS
jgi:sigma-B regulation protein RsbU (phosphoserine phosphatase)